MTELKYVIQMTLSELSTALPAMDPSSTARIYGEAIKFFLTNQLAELERHIATNVGVDDPVADLMRLRLDVRRGGHDPELVARVVGITRTDHLLAGEAAFVLASEAEQRNDDIQAKDWYQTAFEQLSRHGCRRKAAKSFHNVVATESRINPHKRLVAEYHEAILLCDHAGEMVARANAELNLSREYQLMGALNLALRYAQRAVETAGEHQGRSLQYFLSVAQRCHVLIELSLKQPAYVDFEELQCAPFPEIAASCRVLGALLETKTWVANAPVGLAAPTASWVERKVKLERGDSPGSSQRFTQQENELIELLASVPKTKHELIDALFGTRGDPFAHENRLKQLLHRIRKKAPGLIAYHEQRYFICEPEMFDGKQKSRGGM